VTAATSPSTSPLSPGCTLDRYELLCPIAEGGMASVWVARQRGKHGFEKLVAIKTILPKFAADIRFQEMFLDEARIASRIEHVNVAQILDLGEEREILYLVMEYVDGDALSKLHRACHRKGVRTPAGVVLRVLADACAGLHEAHELKDGEGGSLDIVHRDISPHNVLVSTRGIAKLIDFGIAKARSRVGTDTGSGLLKGKIQYMAPEQALGQPVDRRADVWAVGAILYHLLMGRPPYEGDNQLATLHLLGSGRPPVPLGPDVHPAIAAVVGRALSHQPDNRYPTAAVLHDAIEDAMSAARVATTPSAVAAFAAEHLSERAERRRQAIEYALTAAAERRRVEDLLRPTGERTSVSTLPPHSAARLIAPLARDSVPPREGRTTIPEVPAPKAPGEAIAKLTARLPEPTPQSPSYATLGPAALESPAGLPQARSRRAVVVLGAAAAALVSGLALTLVHPWSRVSLPATATMARDVPAASLSGRANEAPPVDVSAAARTTTAQRVEQTEIPAIAATSLPKASTKPTFLPTRATPPHVNTPSGSAAPAGITPAVAPPVVSVATPPVAPIAAPSAAVSAKAKLPVVDDGF
jgi:serine/threonine-protein kinase